MNVSLDALNPSDDRVVAVDGARRVNWRDLRAAVAAQRGAQSMASEGRRRVLLRGACPIDFTAELLAALAEDHVAVIPPNFQPQTLGALAELPSPIDVPPRTIELYTSGSSGEPKCVAKEVRQLEAECRTLESCWGKMVTPDAIVLATTPHHHIYGLLFRLLWPLLSGRPFDNATISEPTAFAERLRATESSLLVSSPAQLSRLHQLLDLTALPNQPALVFSSGGPLDAATAESYRRAWGSAPTEVYGSTESGGIAWRRQDHGPNWTPLPQVQVAMDTDGALLVRSPFLPDHEPLRLQDAVELAADGTFILRGRLDRVVKIEEKRLSLPEMEAWLAGHPGVAAAAVAPVAISGRTLVGAVVVAAAAAPQRKVLIESLRQHLGQRFDPVLLPRRWRFVDALPYGERGKLLLNDVARLLEATPCA
ncbi:MAG: Surfactin synthase subunit 3 [Candidatus Accumulibacter adjunctus]|uniref:Long-chain-fatty-acid--CoA ligase n=1 Tax=Candidatus Accumulibacter adjunctus TaxID=1454001 RepID=A0A011M7D7_9PROT|nr:MAG: Surfactin synthase subunit 3 [Candidatus Accumulibacter adjunctus]